MTKFSLSDEEKLIEEVQKYPVIYMKKGQRTKKNQAWSQITKKLGVFTEVDLRRRWKSIVCTRNRLKLNGENNEYLPKKRKTKWSTLFSKLSFLDDVDNILNYTSDYMSDTNDHQSEDVKENSPSQIINKTMFSSNVLPKSLNYDIEAFFESATNRVKRLSTRGVIEALWVVNSVLKQLELKNIQPKTDERIDYDPPIIIDKINTI
ncbi:uncharacterized protein LOC126841213 [Adelges cooleyi]|uniref:uncharacterized protein LOC126841213 n=1 Tax=Adelges cooleyi TaxID=133065 RepID=UPI00217F34AF|nr:uncharacterized protein LOC126841213 [Adelges cooleyi]